jgi:myotubularin-related protein 1/2
MSLPFTVASDNPLNRSSGSISSEDLDNPSFVSSHISLHRRSSIQSHLLPGEEFIVDHRCYDWPIGGVPIFLYIQSSAFAAFMSVTNYRLTIEVEDPQVLAAMKIREDYFEVPLLMLLKCERTISREIIKVELTTKDERNIKFAIRPDLKLKSDIYEAIYTNAFSSNITKRFCFSYVDRSAIDGWSLYDPFVEYGRFGISPHNSQHWAFLDNSNGCICPTYGPCLVVPQELSLDDVMAVAQFRTKQRIPVLVWVHPTRKSTLWRSSQPKTGIAWRCSEDENFLQLIADSCKRHLLHIYDCRPYINAHANRAKGGGVEPKSCYRNTDLTFLNIANIHAVREAWKAMLTTVNSVADSKYFSCVERSGWLDLVYYILLGTSQVVESISNGYAVLVHCSDGWDRTAELSALSQMCLDSYYRTQVGFVALIEKDWLSLGHMFDRRLGHSSANSSDEQRSPIFIQFLDCVHQLLLQFPTHFEFSEAFLVELAYHAFSGCYGTFMCNSHQDRLKADLYKSAPSVWGSLLEDPKSRNPFYQPGQDDVLFPNPSLRRLQVWHELFSKWHPEFYYPVQVSNTVKEHKESIMRSANSGLDYLRLQLQRSMEELHTCQRQLTDLTKGLDVQHV